MYSIPFMRKLLPVLLIAGVAPPDAGAAVEDETLPVDDDRSTMMAGGGKDMLSDVGSVSPRKCASSGL